MSVPIWRGDFLSKRPRALAREPDGCFWRAHRAKLEPTVLTAVTRLGTELSTTTNDSPPANSKALPYPLSVQGACAA